jgi:hypothetical protein
MKEHHRTLISELSSLGLSARLQMTNGNHVRIAWDVAGKTYCIVTAATPSDQRAMLNARATIRRQLKVLGIYRHPTAIHPKPVTISGPTAHLCNELTQLRSSAAASVCARIRAIEIELGWRQHAQAQQDAR